MAHERDGTTVLVGRVADQVALHGLLQKLRDLGVTLISVNEDEVETDTVRGESSEQLDSSARRLT